MEAMKSHIFYQFWAVHRYLFSQNGVEVSQSPPRRLRRFMLVKPVVMVQAPRTIQVMCQRVLCLVRSSCICWNMLVRIWSWWEWQCPLEIWKVRICWIIWMYVWISLIEVERRDPFWCIALLVCQGGTFFTHFPYFR